MTTRIPTMYGRYYVLTLVWRGKEYDITVFRNKLQKLQRPQAQKIAQSVYPSSRVIKYHESDPTDGPVILTTEAYKKISKKKGNKRRASFCARMKGMKKKLTSKKTASDPDSRINKSLRAWNC